MELDTDKPSLVFRIAQRIFMGLANGIWGLEVTGLDNVPLRGPLIVACNHISLWDGPLLVALAGPERYLRFLTKVEAFDVPMLGWFLRSVGMVPLDRHSDVGALRRAVELLKKGAVLGIFPEGTRSKNGSPGRPKSGIGFLARESGAPVLTARVARTDQLARLTSVSVRFGGLMRFPENAQGGRAECQAFAQDVMRQVQSL